MSAKPLNPTKDKNLLLESLNNPSILNSNMLDHMKKIDGKVLNGIYAIGYDYYQSGRYAEAVSMFQWLCLCDYSKVKHFKALASAQFMLKEYEHAIALYSFCYILDKDNPEYPFQSGLCHLALGKLDEAESGFYAASLWSENEEAHQEIQQKARSMLDLVRRKKSIKLVK